MLLTLILDLPINIQSGWIKNVLFLSTETEQVQRPRALQSMGFIDKRLPSSLGNGRCYIGLWKAKEQALVYGSSLCVSLYGCNPASSIGPMQCACVGPTSLAGSSAGARAVLGRGGRTGSHAHPGLWLGCGR